jgi:hypothetical protein
VGFLPLCYRPFVWGIIGEVFIVEGHALFGVAADPFPAAEGFCGGIPVGGSPEFARTFQGTSEKFLGCFIDGFFASFG